MFKVAKQLVKLLKQILELHLDKQATATINQTEAKAKISHLKQQLKLE